MQRGERMKQIYSDVIQFRGSHYEYGIRQGEWLRNSFILENRKKQWGIRRPRFTINESEAKAAITTFAPGIWEELQGLMHALKWDINDVLQEFGGYRLAYTKSGCSIFTGSNYMIRNYDYHPKTYEGRYTIFQPNDQGFATIGPSQRITGRMDGMNEHGLALGYNFIHRRKPGDGFICNMIGRIILESCRNTEEAIHLLKDIPHRHSFSYVLLDRSGDSIVVEASPRAVKVRQSHVCTNHFETLTAENRYHLDDSYRRKRAIDEQKGSLNNAYQAFEMMNNSTRGVFSTKYKNWSGTIHTSGYFPKELKVWFALGGDRKPEIFDFKRWLKGENIAMKRVIGMVDTDLPFVHMEENVR